MPAYVRSVPPPSIGRPAYLLLVLCVAFAAALLPAPLRAGVAPRLSRLLGESKVVVAGRIGAVTPYDGQHAVVVEVNVDKMLRGDAVEAKIAIALLPRFPSASLPFAADQRGVAFLRPSVLNSYLRKTLPQGPYFEMVSEQDGLVVAAAPAESERITAVVQRLIAMDRQALSDPAERARAERDVVFALISCSTRLLVEDGIAGLTEIANLAASLTSAEQQVLEKAIERDDLPRGVRIALIDAVGSAGLRQLVPALRRIDSPDLLAASWRALANLGEPVDPKKLEEDLGSWDPRLRAVAARTLLEQRAPDALARAADLAIADPDPEVRKAVIEGLGDTKQPEALPTLERAFGEGSPEIRQAATRAIAAIGGRPAVEVFGRLAFTAPDEDAQRYAVASLMLLKVQRDDPVVRRIATTHPNPAVRELAARGPHRPGH